MRSPDTAARQGEAIRALLIQPLSEAAEQSLHEFGLVSGEFYRACLEVGQPFIQRARHVARRLGRHIPSTVHSVREPRNLPDLAKPRDSIQHAQFAILDTIPDGPRWLDTSVLLRHSGFVSSMIARDPALVLLLPRITPKLCYAYDGKHDHGRDNKRS